MIPFKTDDGSTSYRKTNDSEPFHTKAGAIVEALEKHARALKVWEKENPVIFDVCSGLAYSAAAALEEIRTHGNDSIVTIYLFENDRLVLERILDLPDKLDYAVDGVIHYISCFEHFQNAARKFLNEDAKIYEVEKLRIIFVFGDFEQTLEQVSVDADYVFYAPFSPQITPEMWTKEKFELLHQHMVDGGKLSTYAYARSVRDAMNAAGFKLQDGPTIGRRSPSLIGIKQA